MACGVSDCTLAYSTLTGPSVVVDSAKNAQPSKSCVILQLDICSTRSHRLCQERGHLACALQQGMLSMQHTGRGDRHSQDSTKVTVDVSQQHAAPEGSQVRIVDRWWQGHCARAARKGVAGPAD